MTATNQAETYASGRKKTAYHLAKENGGHAGLYAYKVQSCVEKLQAMLAEAETWADESRNENTKEFVTEASSVIEPLQRAAKAIDKLGKKWSPKGTSRGVSAPLEIGNVVEFKPVKESEQLAAALSLKEGTTGKVVAKLPGDFVTVDFGTGVAFPCKAKLLRLTKGADVVELKQPEKKEDKVDPMRARILQLGEMTREELRKLAKSKKLSGYSKFNVPALAQFIAENE